MILADYGLSKQDVMNLTEKYMIETYPRFPFVAERAKGQYLYDSDGNAWLIYGIQ